MGRAGYDQEIVATLSQQLTLRFGRGFDRANPHRMIKFAQLFPDPEIVAALGQQLSWTHFKTLLPVRSPEARAFYIDQAVGARLSVRALRELIGRQGFERKRDRRCPGPRGNGWTFVARQKRMTIDNDDFYLAPQGRTSGANPRDLPDRTGEDHQETARRIQRRR
ncbi:MAG: DUF1016 N-terminal domain-containing protein [Propioniciclava sp.]|uniref:DUF1016 N-terminal domain-containing protein n=1 Tax=Propioniciclava sp. TaxID=2038686 RepID=UPI0039E694D5